jgi:hypothetical protein
MTRRTVFVALCAVVLAVAYIALPDGLNPHPGAPADAYWDGRWRDQSTGEPLAEDDPRLQAWRSR